jgi:protein-S-isoprenylcysteine O-methyltransferase Ste14
MLLIRMAIQTAALLLVLGAILLGGSGDAGWVEAWAFLVEMGLASLVIGLWLMRRDPALLASRLTSPAAGNQTPRDRVLFLAISVGFIAWMGLMALDRRWRWSAVPLGIEVLGAAMIVAGLALVCWVFAVNSFAAPQVRVQAERRQTVISSGPYVFVRHPMYAGGAIYLIGMALMLGSWWGLIGAAVLIAAIGLRAVGEEAVLRQGLEGYDDYARRVRWRILPGVW